jgi:hypothetical protein
MVLPPVFRLSLLFGLLFSPLAAQSGLHGRIQGTRYHSPTGEFSLTIPVLPELGGQITDTPNVVTFQDQFNLHASIACFTMDATQRWENETRGRRDYLVWFFSNFVQSDFAARFPGAQIESAKFFSSFLGGTLLAYNLLPGGSMFQHRVVLGSSDELPEAKRGNLLFVHSNHVYVVSTELAERVTERSIYIKTVEEQNEILQRRLFDLVARMTFADEAAAAPAPRAGTTGSP